MTKEQWWQMEARTYKALEEQIALLAERSKKADNSELPGLTSAMAEMTQFIIPPQHY